MHAFKSRTLIYSMFMALAALGVMGQPTHARAAGAEQKSPQALQQEARQISSQLGKIARKTISSDPDLQAEGKHFSEHMIKAMQTIGYSPKADGKKMAALQKALRSGNLSKEDRQAKIKEFQGLRMHMMKAQAAVMQNKSLRQERQKLSQDTMTAMKKQDPRTAKLLKRLNEIGRQLRSRSQASRTAHK